MTETMLSVCMGRRDEQCKSTLN